METKGRIEQFIKEFLKDNIVKKNLCNGTWLSGSSTTIYPITIWKKEVVIQWKSDRRIFDKFIKRTVEKYSDLFKDGYFWKSDGSCPSTITFVLKESL